MPSRIEAAALLNTLRMSERLLAHSVAVAEICAFLCSAMARRDVAIDARRAEAAALLHDLDKALPQDDPMRELGHGAAGAAWLRRRGYEELAPAVAQHPVMQIGHAASFEVWSSAAGLEGRVVAYSDKRAREDVVTLTERFARWHERYPHSQPLDLAEQRARALETEICTLAGIATTDVRRERWVAEMLRAGA